MIAMKKENTAATATNENVTAWQAVDNNGRVLGTADNRANLEKIFKNYLAQGLVRIEKR